MPGHGCLGPDLISKVQLVERPTVVLRFAGTTTVITILRMRAWRLVKISFFDMQQ